MTKSKAQIEAEEKAEEEEKMRMEGLNNGTIRPEVGMGASQIMHSDINPFFITRVSENGKIVWLQEAKAKEVKHPKQFSAGGFVGHYSDNHEQRWKVEPDPKGAIHRAQLTKKGWHSATLGRVKVGYAVKFYDYNF